MSFLAGKIRPRPGGWFIVKLAFREREQDVYERARLNIIQCRLDLKVNVFKVEGKKNKKDILNKLKNPDDTLPLKKFRNKYVEREGDIWGPYDQKECVRQFMQGDKLVRTTNESLVDGVSLAKEVQAVPLVEASVDINAKNIQRLATAVVETTELKEEPPEKEIADIDKILLCSCWTGDYSGRKGYLHVWYIVMASVIAAAGLWLNSGPTVVASMLVSSMMEPIKGIASICKRVESTRSYRTRFLFHLLTLVCDMCICIFVGACAGWAAQTETWGPSERESFDLNGTKYRYTLLELMSGNNVIGEGRAVVDGKITMFLPGEMAGRTQSLGLYGAIIVAGASAAAMATADKSDNKNALIGIGISASLLPPMVNAGMLWSFIGSDRIPLEFDFATLGAISFALTWINVGMIILVWSAGYFIRERWFTRSTAVAQNREIEMTNNPMRERTPLLF